MNKIFKNKSVSLIIVIILGIAICAPAFAATNTTSSGSTKTISSKLTNPLGATTTIGQLVNKIVTYIMGLVGVIAVLMLVWGGVTYMTSAGNEERIGQAKKIITNTIIGLVIAILAYVIVNAVVVAIGA